MIRFNDSASALDPQIIAIHIALEEINGTRDTITIHTDNVKLDLNTTTRAMRDVAVTWIPVHTGIPGSEKVDQATKRGL